MSDLIAELRARSLHADDALAARAADEIARLRRVVVEAHVVRPKMVGATCSCGKWLVRTASDLQAAEAHAAHVAAILEGRTS